MEVIIRGLNVKITDALREYTETKLGRLDRYLPQIAEARVDISRQNTRRGEDVTIAQITVRHNRGAILRAEERMRGEDRDSLHRAINMAVDKMYRQIERFKGKRRSSRKGRERFIATAEELNLAEDIPGEVYFDDTTPDAEELIDYEEEIVRRKNTPVIAMTEEEAIEQMELLGHTFFMFFNATSGSINVLYRRTNGGYGVLVPQIQ